jgi:hypothetical protein
LPGFAHLRLWSKSAERGIEGDLFDGFDCLGGRGSRGLRGAGEVEAGDLETVEEQAGAARIEVVGGDALEDLADGGLDGGAVLGQGQIEGSATAAAPARVFDGAAGGVVVVTELFVAEAGRAATASVDEDVAALVAFGFGCFWCNVRHGSPLLVKVRKVFKIKWIGSYLGCGF